MLAVCALCETLFYRVLGPLLRSEADILPGAVLRAAGFLGQLSLNVVALLGLLLLGGVLLRLVRPGLIRNPMGHMSFALVGGVHLLLSALLLLAPGVLDRAGVGTSRGQVLLQVSYACLCVLLVAAILPLRAGGRLKAGALLLLLPVLCHFYTYWGVAQGAALPGQMDALSLGQVLLGVAQALTVVCFCPASPRRGVVLGAAVALLTLLVSGAICLLDSELLARLAHAAFSVRLGPSRALQLLYLFCVASLVFSVVVLLCQPQDALRLRGLGLLCVGLAGYQVQEGYRMAILLLGLFAILRSALPAPPRLIR